MATASNAQREPSMEEILASIRKIIEDSDPVRKDEGTEPAGNADVRAADTIADMDAFRAELRGGFDGDAEAARTDRRQPELKPASAPVEQPIQPFSASFSEQVDAPAASADGVDDIGEQWDSKQAARVSSVPTRTATFQRPSDVGADTLSHETTSKQPDATLNIAAPDEAKTGASAPSSESQVKAARLESLDDAENTTSQTLISEQTGRQVAAAFGELSEAFASRNRKSLDEMAEEMLRPMLQDWLDNNLPILVERLVREEIERVARGT
jgi:cell pole-organizing protein PopZ